jgi:hypothetical protein
MFPEALLVFSENLSYILHVYLIRHFIHITTCMSDAHYTCLYNRLYKQCEQQDISFSSMALGIWCITRTKHWFILSYPQVQVLNSEGRIITHHFYTDRVTA